MRKEELKPFNQNCVSGLMRSFMEPWYDDKGTYADFCNELESILRTTQSYEWHQKPKDKVVLGDVWELRIGEFRRLTLI